jgi:hypothetical protein
MDAMTSSHAGVEPNPLGVDNVALVGPRQARTGISEFLQMERRRPWRLPYRDGRFEAAETVGEHQRIGASAFTGVHEFYSMFINLSQVNGATRGRDVASFGFLPVSQCTGPP